MNRPGAIPMPSESVVLTLARIASKVQATLVPKPGVDRERVSVQTARNDRRRAMESVLVLLDDPAVREYVAELERRGLLPLKR